jgi:hypothetical protein
MRLVSIAAARLSVLPLVFLCGCGLLPNSSTVQKVAPAVVTQIGGSVHGGNQPVVGAQVQLWQVGTTGYGLGSAALGSAVTSGAGGAFTLTGAYTCPSPSTFVYVTATGGNPGLTAGTNNSALVMMTALGPCGNLTPSTFISINEVTTVASVYALQQFMSPLGNIGSYGSSTGGISNAFQTVNTLVNTSSGAAQTAAVNGSTASILPTATINTIANILTPCVNSTGPTSASCSALFSAATPAGGSTPVSTLSAAISIARNPGVNQTALFNLSSANPAFQPTLSTKPADWTISIGYAQGGAPNALALDSFGNVWTVVYNIGGSSSSVTEMTNVGVPAANSPYSNTFFNGSWGLAIDTSNNVWVSNHDGASLMELDLGGTNIQGINGIFNSIGLSQPEGVALDGNGDIWIANNLGNSVTELVPGSGTFSPTQWTGGGLSRPAGIASDENGNTWVTNNTGGSITSIPQYGNSGVAFGSHTGGGLSSPAGIAVDGSGNLWVTNTAVGEIAEIGGNGTAISPTGGYTAGGVTNSYSTAIDGTGNVWVADYGQNQLTLLSAVGTALGPALGSQGGLGQPKSLAIDASGNIWVGNFAPATGGATVTEFVGLAFPTYMPLQAAIQSSSIGLAPGSLQIVSRSINSATMGTPYSFTFNATGGTGNYTWSISTGLSGLNAIGLTFTTGGVLSGTPNTTGNFSFDVTVKDTVTNQTLQVPYTLQVGAAVQTVCSHDGSGNSFLHGDYAFLMNGFNPSGHYYDMIGAFTANGTGGISGGIADANGDQNISNFASGAVNYNFAGTYSVGSTDDRGIMTVSNTNSGASGTGLPATSTYCFALDTIATVSGLGTVAESGRIIENDGSGFVMTGFFVIQNPNNFNNASVTSGYAFGMQGVDGTTPNRRGLIGQFSANGSGGISSGQADFSQVNFTSGSYVNSYIAANAITSAGSSYSVASNGRGTLTLVINGNPLQFIFYVVGTGNQLYLMSANASTSGNTPLLIGHAVQQSGVPYSTSNVKAAGIFRSSGTTNPNSPPLADNVEVGQLTLDGAGNASYLWDQNSGGVITTPATNTGTGTYTVSSLGYLAISGGTNYYLYAPGAGFGLDNNVSVNAYFMLPQSVPSGGFSTSNLSSYLNGNYGVGTMFPAAYNISSNLLTNGNQYPSTFDAYVNLTSGTLSIVQDQVQAPGTTGYVQVNQTATNTYALDSTYGPATGRFIISNGSKANVVGYIVSPTQVFLLQNQSGQDTQVLQADHW